MTNHAHLLVSSDDRDAASKLMQSLGRRYVRHFNEKYERTGTLWEGRFKAHPVQYDHHLINVYRYIELNPVRARMVAAPTEYRWSSHLRNALGRTDALVADHEIYSALGPTPGERQRAYQALFGVALETSTLQSIRCATSSGRPYGDESFCQRLAAELGLSLGGKNGRPRKDLTRESGQLALTCEE